MSAASKPRLPRWQFLLKSAGRMLKPHPLHTTEKAYQMPPFFIVSPGRSGSTLLRAMLIQDPEVHIPPEFKLIPTLLQQFRNVHRYLPWGYAVRLFGATVARGSTLQQWQMTLGDFYSQADALPAPQRSLANLLHIFYLCHGQQVKPTATRWGDKTPLHIRHLDKMDSLFPDAKIIYLMRDGRDVVASIFELGWHPSLEIACDVWLKSMATIGAYPQRHDEEKFLEIHYEALVSEPEVTLQRVCGFIGLCYKPEMLHFHRDWEQMGFEARQAHHAGVKQAVNEDSVGSWTRRLNESEQRYVMERLGPMLRRTGYELA